MVVLKESLLCIKNLREHPFLNSLINNNLIIECLIQEEIPITKYKHILTQASKAHIIFTDLKCLSWKTYELLTTPLVSQWPLRLLQSSFGAPEKINTFLCNISSFLCLISVTTTTIVIKILEGFPLAPFFPFMNYAGCVEKP